MLTLKLPEVYRILQSLPEDPENSTSYGMQTPNSLCMILAYPLSLEQTMSINKEWVIDGIRHYLAENQGIIQVECGTTKKQVPYIYSIVKNISQEGCLYILTMHFVDGVNSEAFAISAQFQEIGTTGIREAQVFEYARRNNIVDEEAKGWVKDPYDENFTYGIPMNLSEDVMFDPAFPSHPLTQLRELLKFIKENN